MLIHREYINGFPEKLVIGNDQVIAENANRPHGHGKINPSNFTPYPKNPIIARLFKEIGRADELGSGVRNLYKYTRIYSGGDDPQLLEGDVFKIIIPVTPQATPQAENDKINALLEYCIEPRSREGIQTFMGLKDRKHLRLEILNPLIQEGKHLLTIPEKPTSPNQKYYSKLKGPKTCLKTPHPLFPKSGASATSCGTGE